MRAPSEIETWPYFDVHVSSDEPGDLADKLDASADRLGSSTYSGYDPSKFTKAQAIRTLRQVADLIRSAR